VSLPKLWSRDDDDDVPTHVAGDKPLLEDDP
jgi:hypothetical protein